MLLLKSLFWGVTLAATVYSHFPLSPGLQEHLFRFRPRRAENHDVSKIYNQIVSLACVRELLPKAKPILHLDF
jgi:hypothetical protein